MKGKVSKHAKPNKITKHGQTLHKKHQNSRNGNRNALQIILTFAVDNIFWSAYFFYKIPAL